MTLITRMTALINWEIFRFETRGILKLFISQKKHDTSGLFSRRSIHEVFAVPDTPILRY